jgi:cell division septation protein DedD
MNPQMTGSTCPLCKRPMGAADSPTTRLCSHCQTIVRNILPGSEGQSAYVEPQLTAPESAPINGSNLDIEVRQLDLSHPGTTGGDNLAVDHNATGDDLRFDDQTSPPVDSQIDFNLGPLDEGPPAVTARIRKGVLESVLRESGALALEPVSGEQPSLLDEFETLRRTAGLEEPAANGSDNAKSNGDSPSTLGVQVADRKIESTRLIEQPAHNLPAVVAPRPNVRPVSDAWNLKADEWPVLIDDSPQPSSGKWKVLTAVGLLLLVVAAVAVSYWVVIRPRGAGSRALGSDSSAQQPASAARSGTVSAATPATDSEAGKKVQGSAPQQPSPAASKQENQAPEPSTARYSLQAASVPNLTAANQFAEKLVSAGVPAYVVAADLPGRGRWYRVRVGRFNSQEDASRFASDAKLRAKSAGISLTLVPCDYEKPEK